MPVRPSSTSARPDARPRRVRALLLAAVAAVCAFALSSAPADAAALTKTSWTVSNNQVGATGVKYSYAFSTATAGTIKTITFAVSGSGLAGTPTIGRNYGIGAGTVARSGQTITYTVTTAVAVAAGIPIYLELSGLANSSTAASYTTAITTQTAVPAAIDTGTPAAVTLAAANTAVTVAIAQSLTFTIDKTAFELDLDPSLPALADQSAAVGLTVQTNANSGYTLSVADSAAGLQSSGTGTPAIAKVSAGKAAAATWPGAGFWGYTVTGTGATVDPAFSGSRYAGYAAAGEQIASRATSTGAGADTITLTNRVAIDFGAAAGVYGDLLTYTVTPNYA